MTMEYDKIFHWHGGLSGERGKNHVKIVEHFFFFQALSQKEMAAFEQDVAVCFT